MGWCDRILYNSLPDMVGTLEPEVSPGGRVDLEGAPCDNYFAITGQLMASDHSAIACGFNLKVWEVPSWPRSWPNFSLSQLHSHRNAWANLHILGQPDTFLAQGAGGAGPARLRLQAADIRREGGARSHCRFVLPSIRFIPDSLTYSVPLFLKRQCDNPTRRSRATSRPSTSSWCAPSPALLTSRQAPFAVCITSTLYTQHTKNAPLSLPRGAATGFLPRGADGSAGGR
jgi:hypothetical protein